MRRRTLHAVLLAALVTTTADAADDFTAIVNGTPTFEYPAVVALLLHGRPHCTGTLVTKRVVVTAAHCLAEPQAMSIYLGVGLDFDVGTTIAVADARHHPGFDPESLTNDIAVLFLAHEAPVTPIPIFGGLWDASFIGREVTLVGYGATGPGVIGPHLKRTGAARLTSFDETSLTFLPDPSQTCSGDSGGPALLNIDGGDVLIGITSFGDRTCAQYGTDTRADRFVSTFIGPYIAAQSRGWRHVGELCRADDQCIEQQCDIAALGESARYCTRSCTRDDQCPGAMSCTGEPGEMRCMYRDGGPAGLGVSCERNEDCASGVCAALAPDLPATCSAWCAPSVEDFTCGASEACFPNVLEEDTFVCGPAAGGYSAGCASGPAPSLPMLMLLVLWAVRRYSSSWRIASRIAAGTPASVPPSAFRSRSST